MSSRDSLHVVEPFFLDDINLSSRFLMWFGKDRNVWVKDTVFSLKSATTLDLVGNTIRFFARTRPCYFL